MRNSRGMIGKVCRWNAKTDQLTRWMGVALLRAQEGFRRVRGHKEPGALAAALGLVSGLGAVYGAEIVCLGEDTDLASVLFEMNLPAVRVATGPVINAKDQDERLPFAPTVALSCGRLVELIRRCMTH